MLAPLLGVALVSACAGPRPAVPKAATVVPPATWRDGAAAADAAVDARWWRSFGDPVLSELVERALSNNDDVAIAAARVEEFRAQYRLARAEQLPNINFTTQGVREKQVDAFGRGVYQTANEGQIGISYDADLFGRLRNATRAARAGLLAGKAGQDAVRLAVAAGVANGYLNLRALDARLAIIQETLAAREASLKLARRRAEAGYAPALDQRQAEAEYSATQQLIPATQLAIRRTEDALSLLLGESPGAIARGAPLQQLTLPPIDAGLPSSLLRRRPDLYQAEEQLVAADRTLDSVRASFLPTFQLNGNGGYVVSTLLTKPFAVFQLGAGVLQPLIDNGRLKARQASAVARRNQEAFSYRRTALQAFREVEDALAATDLSGRQEAALQSQENALQATLQLATNRYREGYSPYLEQLDAQRALLSAQLSLVQARNDRLNAAVSLYQALGGGWSEPSAEAARHP